MQRLRKAIIIAVALAAAVSVYMLFIRERGADLPSNRYNVPTVPIGGESPGSIGDVRVGHVGASEYIQRDDQKNIRQVFGFQELLHKSGDNWELAKPYMQIHQRGLVISVTADKGNVIVETAGQSPSPKDANLEGNVRVHIVRSTAQTREESSIYMDEIVFVSARSTFYTHGPVRYEGPRGRMEGSGLEAVYNAEMNQLMFFRLNRLDYITFKMPRGQGFFSTQRPEVVVASNVEAEPVEPATEAGVDDQLLYYCMMRDNVVVRYGSEILVTENLIVRNILWDRPAGAAANETSPASEGQPAAGAAGTSTTADEEYMDVTIRCDGDIVIRPQNAPAFGDIAVVAGRPRREVTTQELETSNYFLASAIDYDMALGAGLAHGPVKVAVFSEPLEAEQTRARTLIEASSLASYSAQNNTVVFSGDVAASMIEPGPQWTRTSSIFGEEMTAVIAARSKLQDASTIESVQVTGDIVRMETVNKAGDELLGGVNIKCKQVDYNGLSRELLATGPGVIVVDNSRVSDERPADGVNLSRRCYAAVDSFSSLRWLLDHGTIFAEGGAQGLRIAYWPILELGMYGPQTLVDTTRVQANLITADGRTDLESLSTSGGVFLQRGESDMIWGEQLNYERKTGLLTVLGSELRPCIYNGIKGEAFQMNMDTGEVKTRVTGGGITTDR